MRVFPECCWLAITLVAGMVHAAEPGVTETHMLDRIVHGWRVDEPMTLTASSRLVSVQ